MSQESIQLAHVGGRDPSVGAITQGEHQQEAEMESGARIQKQALQYGMWASQVSAKSLCQMPTLMLEVFYFANLKIEV